MSGLRSEVARHMVALVISVVAAVVLMAVLFAVGELAVSSLGALLGVNVLAPAALAGIAVYGPAYLLLSRSAWGGLFGEALREELRRTAPPRRGILSELLVSSPTAISSTAALLSLAAVYFLVIVPSVAVEVVIISVACVLGSWILVLATFAVDYAREWAESDGFGFPGNEELGFTDFIYLAGQVSTTYSTSDVSTTNRRSRRLVTIHSITAFIFATVILAFLVTLLLGTVSN